MVLKIKKAYILLSILAIAAFVVVLIYSPHSETQKKFTSSKFMASDENRMEESNLWRNVDKVKIAVLDSGIDKNHKILKGKIKDEYNAIDESEPAIDEIGHGTAVSGVIVTESPEVELYSVKVLDNRGKGTAEDFVKGIEWSIEKGVDIINLSFGISKDKQILKDSINRAIDSGIIIVSAAGNTYGGDVDFPAMYEKVISVTAVDSNNKIASFAPKGKVDFSAPGVNIPIITLGDGNSINSGTSLAAPYISSIVALILQNRENFNINPNKDMYKQIYEHLKSLSTDLGEKGKDVIFGEGLVTNNYNRR